MFNMCMWLFPKSYKNRLLLIHCDCECMKYSCVFTVFSGERRLEICCNGLGPSISVVIYNCCHRWNSWHHITSTNFIWHTCSDWYKNVWNCISYSKATCHPANLIIYYNGFLHIGPYLVHNVYGVNTKFISMHCNVCSDVACKHS